MNLVGKIFVFLILCMSLMFASFGVVLYATHTNWREEVMRSQQEASAKNKPLGWKLQKENEEAKNRILSEQKLVLEKTLASERAATRQVVSKLESEKTLLMAQQQNALKMYDDLRAAHEKKLAEVATSQNKILTLRGEVDILRKEITDARGEIAARFVDVQTLTELYNQTQGELRRAEERRDQLVVDFTRAKQVLEKVHLTLDTQLDGAKTWTGDGLVTGVRRSGEDTYVQLSIGSDVGLQVGFPLEVYRGSTYVGRVSVVKTTPDKSVAKVILQKAPIQPRDRVESRSSLKLTVRPDVAN